MKIILRALWLLIGSIIMLPIRVLIIMFVCIVDLYICIKYKESFKESIKETISGIKIGMIINYNWVMSGKLKGTLDEDEAG